MSWFNLTCKELPNLPQIAGYDAQMILSMNNEGIYDGGWVGVCRRLMFYYQKQRQEQFNRNAAHPAFQEDVNRAWKQHIQELHDAWDKAADDMDVMHFGYI